MQGLCLQGSGSALSQSPAHVVEVSCRHPDHLRSFRDPKWPGWGTKAKLMMFAPVLGCSSQPLAVTGLCPTSMASALTKLSSDSAQLLPQAGPSAPALWVIVVREALWPAPVCRENVPGSMATDTQ